MVILVFGNGETHKYEGCYAKVTRLNGFVDDVEILSSRNNSPMAYINPEALGVFAIIDTISLDVIKV